MLPTGSHLDRAFNCAPSCALPQVQTRNPAGAYGTEAHRYLRNVLKAGGPATVGAEEAALAQVADWARERCQQIELDGLPLDPATYRGEVSYAYDVATGRSRYLGQDLDRNYAAGGPLGANEIACTLDIVGVHVGTAADGKGSVASVEDFKAEGYETYTPPPMRASQLLFGALCLDRLPPAERPSSSGEYALVFHHIRPDGTHWAEGARDPDGTARLVDAFDLDAFALRLRQMVARVREAEDQAFAGKVLNVYRGPWCRYCPALVHCPAVQTLIHVAASKPEAVAAELALVQAGSLEERRASAVVAYERLALLKQALKEVSSALWAFASEHDIVLTDGRIYGSIERPETRLDGRKTRSALLGLHNPDVADQGVEFEASQASIERALRGVFAKRMADFKDRKAHGSLAKDAAGKEEKKPTLVALKREALAEIQRMGGLKVAMKRSTRLHRKVGDSGEVVVEAVSDEDLPF